jgi:hypothetical protein
MFDRSRKPALVGIAYLSLYKMDPFVPLPQLMSYSARSGMVCP